MKTPSRKSPSKAAVAAPSSEVKSSPVMAPAAAKASPAPKSKQAPAEKKKKASPDMHRVRLTLHCPDAQAIFVAGSFNLWDPAQLAMVRDENCQWTCEINLPPGTYEYRFVVDGQWWCDPAATEQIPNTFGEANSVLRVG